MSVLNFSYATIKDAKAFSDYVRKASSLMAEWHVEVVVRGTYRATMRGDEKAQHVAAVFRYPDMHTARRFYASDVYQKLIPLRDAACEMEIQFYEE
ncbi:MAG: DUF1330 domain-containing protein [Roseibium sp.]|uniref:DUF1330 domain-containing protein n=1 Tax=Roseibium sp. TaxID=1936156 RepID=UPI002631C5D1|nr:DUF1330 domain-containing protein [Roseibium sp.]MCV0429541.1 DUF1330 domain-containing protein [Roseibium sp.]